MSPKDFPCIDTPRERGKEAASSVACQSVLHMYYFHEHAHVEDCFVLKVFIWALLLCMCAHAYLRSCTARWPAHLPGVQKLPKKMTQKESYTIQRMIPVHTCSTLKSYLLPLWQVQYTFFALLHLTYDIGLFTFHFKCITYINIFPLFNWYIFLSLQIVRMFWIEMKCIIIFPLKVMEIFFFPI